MKWNEALGLTALGLGAFAFVTTETLPIGLLPQIAGSLGASIALTGTLVTVYAFTVALTAAPLTALTAGLPRGRLLAVLIAVLIVTNVAAGCAQSFAALFAARFINAAAHAVFWSIVSSCAVRLVPPNARGAALAAIFGGVSVATVLGVPAATLMGQHLGWRAAFLGVAAGSVIVLAVAARTVRDSGSSAGSSLANVRTLLGRGAFRSLLAVTALVVLGQFAAYTYIVPYVERIAGFPASATAPLLLLFGLAGAVGNVVAGVIANRNPGVASLAMTCTIAVALGGLAAGVDQRLAATIFVALWGFGAGGLAVGLQTRVLALAPDAPDLASALFASAFNVGIGGGALLGGAIVQTLGLARSVPVGAGLALIGVVVQAVSAISAAASSRSHKASDSRL